MFDEREIPEIITRPVPELITENVHTVHTESDESSVDPNTSGLIPVVDDSDQLSLEGLNHIKANELMKEQIEDESLAGAFVFAKQRKAGYFTRDGLLYHKATICDRPVERIVVPIGRRQALLHLAHDMVGGHLAIRKTKERIGLNFMWPTMNRDVIEYCKTCEVCQKRAPITSRDRVLIEGGVVSTEPVFSHFYIDALGPLCNHKIE